ncbi:hypothetical protein [Caulobacter sp. CCG-8]|uniref:hypothetical protein n=1 Tax=Caulobacter sp. CCG-8 TaxID=3127958 RepID=UPI00307E9DE1
MGRRDVIEVPKVHRPPDPMVVPKRPNVWTFHTAVPPDQIAARLAPTIGVDVGPNGSQPVVGAVAPTGAEIHRRPAQSKDTRLPMTLDWAAQGEGSLVTCRMRLPYAVVAVIGVLMFVALASLTQIPAAIAAIAVHADHAVGVRRGSPVSDLIEPFIATAIAYGVLRFVRTRAERDRVFLIDHVTRVLQAGPVREGREGPRSGAHSPFGNEPAIS